MVFLLSIALLLASIGCSGGAAGSPDVTAADAPPPDTPQETDIRSEPDAAAATAWDEPVPLGVVGGLPLFEGSVDGGPSAPFVFDTLAQVIFLDEDIVGDVLYHEADLLLGDDHLGTAQVKGRSMVPDESRLGLDIAGLVGQSYIWQRFIVLDYPAGLLYQMTAPPNLDADPLPGRDGASRWTVDVELQNAFPVVRPVLADGDPVALLADTSSPITTITESVFDDIDDGTLPLVAGYVWSSKYGTEDGFLTRIPSVRFGDLVVTDLEAVVIPDDHHLVTILGPNGVDVRGWLGAGFWERFVLGIDPKEGTEESPQLFHLWGDGSDPAHFAGRWDKVGVELAWRDGAYVVEMVFAGSDAEARGVEAGDVLAAVDGAPCAELSLEACRDLLRGVPGDPVVLSVVHADDSAEEITVLVEEILP